MSSVVEYLGSRCDQCGVGVGRSCQARIARMLGRCPSAISRETRRHKRCGWVPHGAILRGVSACLS